MPRRLVAPADVDRRVGIYVRISLDRDGRSPGPERQAEACRALCADKGWRVVETYSDRNVSAFKKGTVRPQYNRLQDDIRAGHINTIVIWKLDRLSRSVSDFSRLLEFLTDHGCDLASVSDHIDSTNAMGKAMLQITSVMAELEAATTGYRVAAAEEDRARQGLWHGGGHRPFGYTRDGHVVPEEAAELRGMARALLDDDKSLWAIATDLNERGVKTTAGKEWVTGTISQMLRSPRLRGVRTHKGNLYPGQWEAIFTEEEHLALCELLSRGWSPETRKKAKYSHLLAGLAVCGTCGHALRWHPGRTVSGREFPKYQCSREPGSSQRCGRLSVDEARADAVVTGMLLAHIRQSMTDTDSVLDDETAARLRQQVADDRAAVNEAGRDRYLRRILDEGSFLEIRDELEQRIATAEAQLAHLTKRSAVEFGPDLDQWWEDASIEEKRRLLRVFIQRVEVAPVGKGGRIFRPERLNVVWVA